MTSPDPETVLTGLLFLFRIWRTCAFFYSSYSISDVVTPSCASFSTKASVMFFVMASSVALHLVPTSDYPRLSLATLVLSIPSQIYSLYFAHRYIGRTLDSRRVTVFLYIVTIITTLETLYLMKLDWDRIE